MPASVIHREIIVLDRTKKKIEAEMAATDRYRQGEYQRYVAYLEGRIGELCAAAVNEHGAASVASLPCPPISALLPGYQVPESQGHEEKIEDADQELMESLGRFDEFLAKEQSRIMAAKPESAGSAPGEAASSGSGSSGGRGSEMRGNGSQGTDGGMQGISEGQYAGTAGRQGEEPGRVGQPGSEAASRNAGGVSAGAGGVSSQSGQQGKPGIYGSGGGGSPESQGDGSIYEDDDIVARQLREAAEREKDPELKKKLWEEYRKYKEANRR